MILRAQRKFKSKQLKWDKLNVNMLQTYKLECEKLSAKIVSNVEKCRISSCTSEDHNRDIDQLYNNVVLCLEESGDIIAACDTHAKGKRVIPGWNDMVKDAHCAARDAFSLWHRAGKPRQGPVYDTMRHSRSLFKYALRYCKRQEKQIKADLLASNLAEKDSK